MDENSYGPHSNFGNDELTLPVNKGEKEKYPSKNVHLLDNSVDAPNLCSSEPAGDLLPSLNCASENSSELRRRRDDLNYPPHYPDLQHGSVPEVRNTDNHIDISPLDFGFISDSEADTDDTDEFHEKPRYAAISIIRSITPLGD